MVTHGTYKKYKDVTASVINHIQTAADHLLDILAVKNQPAYEVHKCLHGEMKMNMAAVSDPSLQTVRDMVEVLEILFNRHLDVIQAQDRFIAHRSIEKALDALDTAIEIRKEACADFQNMADLSNQGMYTMLMKYAQFINYIESMYRVLHALCYDKAPNGELTQHEIRYTENAQDFSIVGIARTDAESAETNTSQEHVISPRNSKRARRNYNILDDTEQLIDDFDDPEFISWCFDKDVDECMREVKAAWGHVQNCAPDFTLASHTSLSAILKLKGIAAVLEEEIQRIWRNKCFNESKVQRTVT